jgi:hypothetical protein
VGPCYDVRQARKILDHPRNWGVKMFTEIDKNKLSITLSDGNIVDWHIGSHTVQIYSPNGNIIDMFTFGWENNETTEVDFFRSLANFLEYMGE